MNKPVELPIHKHGAFTVGKLIENKKRNRVFLLKNKIKIRHSLHYRYNEVFLSFIAFMQIIKLINDVSWIRRTHEHVFLLSIRNI